MKSEETLSSPLTGEMASDESRVWELAGWDFLPLILGRQAGWGWWTLPYPERQGAQQVPSPLRWLQGQQMMD